MDALSLHYSQLLGLGSAWLVDDVDLSLQDQRVVIRLRHDSSVPVSCPECGQACKLHDHAPERRWRHLDTMQFETVLSARVPRSKCLECGVKTMISTLGESSQPVHFDVRGFCDQALAGGRQH